MLSALIRETRIPHNLSVRRASVRTLLTGVACSMLHRLATRVIRVIGAEGFFAVRSPSPAELPYVRNKPTPPRESSTTWKLARVGVSSGVGWFWNSVRARAVWCALLTRNLLSLLEGAVCCSSLRLRSSELRVSCSDCLKCQPISPAHASALDAGRACRTGYPQVKVG